MTPETGKRYFVGWVFDPQHVLSRGGTVEEAALSTFKAFNRGVWGEAMMYYAGTAEDNGDGTLTCDVLKTYTGTGRAYAVLLAEYRPDPNRTVVISAHRGPVVLSEA